LLVVVVVLVAAVAVDELELWRMGRLKDDEEGKDIVDAVDVVVVDVHVVDVDVSAIQPRFSNSANVVGCSCDDDDCLTMTMILSLAKGTVTCCPHAYPCSCC
jgi:hypothetical protein